MHDDSACDFTFHLLDTCFNLVLSLCLLCHFLSLFPQSYSSPPPPSFISHIIISPSFSPSSLLPFSYLYFISPFFSLNVLLSPSCTLSLISLTLLVYLLLSPSISPSYLSLSHTCILYLSLIYLPFSLFLSLSLSSFIHSILAIKFLDRP